MSFRSRVSTAMLAALLLAACALPVLAAEGDPQVDRLAQRLHAIETDPATATLAAYERLQARQALDALAASSSRQRDVARALADRRVSIAEIAARTELTRREIDRLDRERSDLLVEASRQDAERARRETERLRVQAQIQAEEAARLRLAAEEQALARQDAELVLDDVAGSEADKLRAARQRQAELARQEAALMAEDPAGEEPSKAPAKKAAKPRR